jgi:hypothetical protein
MDAFLSDANIFISVNPDFMDTPNEYKLSMSFPENREFYREIRDNVLGIIVRLCIKYGYTDYVVKFSCGAVIPADERPKKTQKIKRMNDFIMMRSDDIRTCIETKCSCINAGLLFLFNLKKHIETVLIPNFDRDEAEIRRLTQLSDDALARCNTASSVKKLRKKSAKFIMRAEELSSIADYNYYTIELAKRIYLRELNKIISCY